MLATESEQADGGVEGCSLFTHNLLSGAAAGVHDL